MTDIQQLYEELYEIAKYVGELDETAVQGAASILSQPRYRGRRDGAALLVADLKHVISTITADLHPELRPQDPSSSRYFQSYARRYFSLDAAGEMLDQRRSFGKDTDKKKRSGSVFTWMNRAVVFRVAAGLLELWNEYNSHTAPVDNRQGGYRIISVIAIRAMPVLVGPGPAIDHIFYDIEILQPVPQLLIIPVPRKLTTISSVSDAEIFRPLPQLITVRMHNEKIAAAVFGAHQVGARIRLHVQRIATRIKKPRPEISFFVDQPIGTLTLDVQAKYDWEPTRPWEVVTTSLLAEETTIDHGADSLWASSNPTVNTLYTLRKHKDDT